MTNLHHAMALPKVTDHAVLRYLERCRGFDLTSLRQQYNNGETRMLTHLLAQLQLDMNEVREFFNPRIIDLAAKTGAKRIRRDDCILVLGDDGVVVTVIKEDKSPAFIQFKRPKSRQRQKAEAIQQSVG